MIRTLQKFKKSKNQPVEANAGEAESTTNNYPSPPPIKVRGKTYQNKSSLDTWDSPQNKANPKKSHDESPNDNKNYKPRAEYRLSKLEEEIVKERVN
jgi:hypothetical protein